MASLLDQDSLISSFAAASEQGGEQLRKVVHDATLRALQGRELTLQNMRSALKSVAQAASAGAAQANLPEVDVEAMLGQAVEGMDDALLKAVEANRVALQQFVAQGADLRDKHLTKAVADLEKMEDLLVGTVRKAAEAAGAPLAGQWAPVLEKMQAGGTNTGAQAAQAVEQLTGQMASAVRQSRASSLRAAQALADSYAALASGVLIGMSQALQQGGRAKSGGAAAKKKGK